MKKRLVLLVVTAVVLAAGGWFQSAWAGSGTAATCSNGYGEAPGHMEVPLITQPVTLALEIPNPTEGQPINHIRLCYSTSKSGYAGPDTTGGSITIFPTYGVASCARQDNFGNALPMWCYVSPNSAWVDPAGEALVGVFPTYSVNPGAPGTNGSPGNHTMSFFIPIVVCQHYCYCGPQYDGVNCNLLEAELGTTGVIQGIVDLDRATNVSDGNPLPTDGTGAMSRAPAGTTGFGAGGVLLWYCANGSCQPLSAPLDIAAGVTTSASAGSYGSECPVGTTCVPRGVQASVGDTGGAAYAWPGCQVSCDPYGGPVTLLPGLSACADPLGYGSYLGGWAASGSYLSTDMCGFGPNTYRAPFGAVVVGTGGADAGGGYHFGLVVASLNTPIAAVTNGGCAYGYVTVAVGESNRSCGWNEAYESGSLVGLALLGADGGIAIGGGDGFIAIGGGNASEVVAVSDTGDARAGCIGPIPWGDNRCAEPGIAVSGTGTAYGDGHTVSGTGSSRSDWSSNWGNNDLWPTVAASGLGNASGGNVAVSGTGSADARTTETYLLTGGRTTYPGIAVAGGNANANGGLVAVSGTGDAQGGTVNVDSDGVG